MVLSLARVYTVNNAGAKGAGGGAGEESEKRGKDEGGRLGSAVSICGPLLDVHSPSSSSSSSSTSSSSAKVKAPTPVAFFTRTSPSSAAGKKQAQDVQNAFMDVQILRPPSSATPASASASASKDGMLRGKDEWIGVMRFWGANLARDEAGAMRNMGGAGEIYEVR